MSNAKYILYTKGVMRIEIEVRIDELLERLGRSFYWLSKETGISHTTLWRLKKGKALGINFSTLEKLCRVLNCQPGDLLRFEGADQNSARKKPVISENRSKTLDS
jgi:Predicted transcriptional regulator